MLMPFEQLKKLRNKLLCQLTANRRPECAAFRFFTCLGTLVFLFLRYLPRALALIWENEVY